MTSSAATNVRTSALSSRAQAQKNATPFVVVATLPGLAFAVGDLLMRDDAPLPTVAPELPPEITHAWVASAWDAGLGFRWAPQSGWGTFDKTPPETRVT